MTMPADDLWLRVRTIMAETLGVPVETIALDSTPETVPSWDSAMHVNLVLALEEELDIRFTAEDSAEMLSAEMIYLIVRERAKG